MRLVVRRLPGDAALQLHDVRLGGLQHLVLREVRVLPPVLLLYERRVEVCHERVLKCRISHVDEALLLVFKLLPGCLALLLRQVLVDLEIR